MSNYTYNKKTVRDVEVYGKRVLVRVDFNVPMNKDYKIIDDTRIRESLPTLKYLRDRGAKLILISHLGRPKGEVEPKLSLKNAANRFSQLLGREVLFSPECVGDTPKEFIRLMRPGDVLVLENVRFHPEEETNDPDFADKLAELGDIYVNDAFGCCHRYHASMVGLAERLPAVAGFLVEKELVLMGRVINRPDHPFVAIMGGSKVSNKIGVITNLLKRVDHLLTGGGIGQTLLAAKGYDMGKSKVDTTKIEWGKELLESEFGEKICLPVDLVVADAFEEEANKKIVSVDEVPKDWMALDIGPRTAEKYKNFIAKARTIVWNGPMGVFEMDSFAEGTREIAVAVATSDGISIIGGGDSVAAVEKMGVAYRINHISTGGGSTLEFLEGIELPAIKVLDDFEEE